MAVCGPPASVCVQDSLGEVRCSPSKGGIALDRNRNAVCGPGQCLPNRYGDVVCSRVAEGSVAFSTNGEPACTQGCVPGRADACVVPRR